jgi:GAF domain-containing protein
MEALLHTVAELTSAAMPGEIEASITLVVAGEPATVGYTGQPALNLDERQYACGHGPCLHAAGTGELTEITDTRSETRWPDYTRRAAERGNGSSLSVPLAIDEAPVSAALNIYAQQPGAFDEASRSAAARIGTYAAVAAGNLHAYHDARDTAANLEAALQSRPIIDQAKGILMERFKLTGDGAFQLLAHVSMRSIVKLRVVAEHLVSTGELPSGAAWR